MHSKERVSLCENTSEIAESCNKVKHIWAVVKSPVGDAAVFDTRFHYVVDSSHSKQFVIFSYLIDNPKCSLTIIALWQLKLTVRQPTQCGIWVDQQVLSEARILELRGFFLSERILKSCIRCKGSTYFWMRFKALTILMSWAFKKHQKPKYWVWRALWNNFFNRISCINF